MDEESIVPLRGKSVSLEASLPFPTSPDRLTLVTDDRLGDPTRRRDRGYLTNSSIAAPIQGVYAEDSVSVS